MVGRTAPGTIWYDHIVDFLLKAAGRSQISIAAPGEVAHIGSGITVAQEHLSTEPMEGPNMPITIDTFIKQHESKKKAIEEALAANDKLAMDANEKAKKKRDTFDVVADCIFPSDKEPLPILVISDWSTVKNDYAKPESPFNMQLILAYRKRYVDRLIDTIRNQYPPSRIVTQSVGSTDLTSDYDITVGIRGDDISQDDLDVIEQFNDEVRRSFGKQPGTIFDTNLYATGFLALNMGDRRLTLPDVGEDMYTMLVEGQDEGALVKQRRYMPYEQWDTFLLDLLINVEVYSEAWSATRKRYETADARYLIYLRELLDEFDARTTRIYVGKAADHPQSYGTAARAAYAEAKATVDAAITEQVFSPAEQTFVKIAALKAKDMAIAQLLLRHKALMWEHHYPDLVMWASNDLYISKMRAIRAYQQEIGKRAIPADQKKSVPSFSDFIQGFRDLLAKKKSGSSFTAVIQGNRDLLAALSDQKKSVPSRDPAAGEVSVGGIQTLADQNKVAPSSNPAGDVRVADLISEAIFFAAEAYLSEGPLRHVVEGVQAAKANPNKQSPDEVAAAISTALRRLTPEQLLQSINEQFGDFLKDFAHYGDTPQFLFRGAKYLQRLFEAADILSTKKKQVSATEKAELMYLDVSAINKLFPKNATEILARLNSKDDGLVAVRKGKNFESNPARDAYCVDEVTTYFVGGPGANVTLGTDLTKRITDMVLQLNAQVRRGLPTTPKVVDERAYFAAIGKSG